MPVCSPSIHVSPDMPASERISMFRKRVGMTQAVLADKVGVSVQTVKNWESGRTRPYRGVMLKVFCALCMTCEERVMFNSRIKFERRFQGRRPSPT